MTFEEVKHKIITGSTPETLEEVCDDIGVLTRGISGVEQSIALRLYDSYVLHGRNGWAGWAMETFGYYSDKATFYRRCGVGEILWRLRAAETVLFRKHLGTDISKLEALLPFMARQVGKPRPGFGALVNFLKLRWKDAWSREQVRDEVDRAIHPDKCAEDSPVQLAFDFDALTPQDEEKIVAFIEEKRLSPGQAGLLVMNGSRITAAALPYMTAHPEEFDAEDIPYLEELRARLEDAARDIASLIAVKSQEVARQ